MSEQKRFTVFNIWERTGITEHLGGTKATERLARMCGIRPGDRVLELGCGTGYTACRLASGDLTAPSPSDLGKGGRTGVDVVAVDIDAQLLRRARGRAAREGVGDKLALVQADAQYLPFSAGVFDVILAESVLVFCDPKKVVAEAYRVLKPGGRLGLNELTRLAPPPQALTKFFAQYMRPTPRLLSEREWQAILAEAGFTELSSAIAGISLLEQTVSHIKVDGMGTYLAGSLRGIVDPRLARVCLSRDILAVLLALPRFLKVLGYGLYGGKRS